MRTGRLFWGVLLVQAGAMVLLYRFGILPQSWYLPLSWWPGILLLLGTSMLVKGGLAKSAVVVLTALFTGFLIAGLFHSARCSITDLFEDHPVSTQVQDLYESADPGVTRATARIDMEVGDVILIEATDHLIHATARSRMGEFRLSSDQREGEAEVVLRQDHMTPFSGGLNELTVRLHPDPVWELSFEIGAADVTADLSRFKVESVSIDAGAASIDVILGANVETARVTIDAGAAEIRLHVPAVAGCEVRMDTGISSRSLPGFERAGEDRYRTENFDAAEEAIFISLDSGASSIEVDRY